MTKRTMTLLVSIGVILIIACLSAIGVIYMRENTRSKYDKHINVARQYYEAQDYSRAILEYQEAINLDRKNEEAYIGIAETYHRSNDLAQAVSYLRTGYEATRSQKISQLLMQYEAELEQNAGVHYTLSEVFEGSGGVTVNRDLLTVFRLYSYDKYAEVYTLSPESSGNVVVYENVPLRFVYASAPSGGDRPVYVEATDIGFLFNGFKQGLSFDRLKELELFDLEFIPAANSDNGLDLVKFALNGCSIRIQTDENGNIVNSAPWNRVDIISSDNDQVQTEAVQEAMNEIADEEPSESGLVVLKGRVYNTAKGNSGAKVTLKVYSGDKADKANLIKELNTTADGKYRVEVEPGTYFVQALLDDEAVAEDKIEIDGSNDIEVLDLSYEKADQLRKGEIRVVLSWPDKDANLDHVLEGINGIGNYVYCSHSPYDPGFHQHYDNSTGELVISSGAEVDGGPEEITVFDVDGSYRYYVESFWGTTIEGATVEVYTSDSSQPTVFTCPSGYTEDSWFVFIYEDGKVKAAS